MNDNVRLRNRGKVKKFLKTTWKTVKVLFTVLVIFAASLFFREQRIPGFLVRKVCQRISTREFMVKCDTAGFGFRHGLRLQGLRVYDLRREDSLESPVANARQVMVNIFSRDIRIMGAEYRRLPDSYYEVSDAPPEPPKLDFDLPDLPDFTVTLDSPVILGITPESVRAKILCSRRRLTLEDVRVVMPDRDCRMKMEGEFVMDLDTQSIHSELKGEVRHSQIHPFVEVMDIGDSIKYIDAFSDITEPIPSRVTIDSNIAAGSVAVKVEVRPRLGRYNGVPMERAEGEIDFKSEIVSTNRVFAFKLDMPLALDHDGRRLSGKIAVTDASGRPRLEYNIKSDLLFDDALKIADIVDPEMLKSIKCDTAPSVTLKGTSGASAEDLEANDLSGTVSLRHGSLDGFRVDDLSGRYALKGDVLHVDAKARGKTGGNLAWTSKFFLNGFEPTNMQFTAKGTYKGGSLEELADALDFDLGERNGKVDWNFAVSGDIGSGTNDVRTLCGSGTLKITEGHLAQMKLFAGLTELLAEKIPGVSFLVNQTQASADYTITNGVFKSENVFIEGGLISIKGWGKYDIAADNLDFTVRVQFLKEQSMVGKIIHPVTLPFTKLLLEFKVDGPIDDPKWRYIKILDRIL